MDIHQTLKAHFDSHDDITLLPASHAIDAYGGTTFSDKQLLTGAIKVHHKRVIPLVLSLANSLNFAVHPEG